MLLVFIAFLAIHRSGAQDGRHGQGRSPSSQDQEMWRWCYDRCVSEWQPWSTCDAICGLGRATRSRTRNDLAPCRSLDSFSCPHHLVENETCSPGCPLGGFPAPNSCQFCPGGKTGQCCQTVASCSNLSQPINGNRVGGIFNVGFQVTFQCRRGYALKGEKALECQSNGRWSGLMPTCEVCPVDFYAHNEKCIHCPANSHTTSEASTSEYMCLCDRQKGFFGPPGGPCQEVVCPLLAAPVNGAISECGNKLGNSCEFTCDDGYVITRGSEQRTCEDNGVWTGSAVLCNRCPRNMYKISSRSCYPCPLHSGTYTDGQMKQGCLCDKGFEGPPGGPCVDINECVTNNGKGPCSQSCSNTLGSFSCGCTIPGYGLDPNDNSTCIVLQTCRNLTMADAPKNGGFVCHWNLNRNSQECQVKCNPGFEHLNLPNRYESCGPNNYVWTYKAEEHGDCIPAFFEGIQLHQEDGYFDTACQSLTQQNTRKLKEDFATALNHYGVCQGGSCRARDIDVVCGSVD